MSATGGITKELQRVTGLDGVRLPIVLLLLASSIAMSMPRQLDQIRLAIELAPLPYSQRRALVVDVYDAVRQLRKELPPDERLALVLRHPWDIDQAIFANYYLYPQRTRVYFGLDSWREHLSPERPKLILQVDRDHPGAIRLASYTTLRSEEIREWSLYREHPVQASPRHSFIVPFVGSVDGSPPDVYTVEAALDAAADAEVEVTFQPSGAETTIQLQAGEVRRLNDVVGELFSAEGVGWLRVRSNVPVRSQWWLVNRGARKGVPIQLFDAQPHHAPAAPSPGETLWLVNTASAAATVQVDQQTLTLAPEQIISIPGLEVRELKAPPGVLAFSSSKLADGNTRFGWDGVAE
jgi:hypothetical protein